MKNARAEPTDTPPEARWHDIEELRWAARHWASRIGVKLVRLQIRPMTSKWASISTAGRLTLNSDLLELPRDLGEFAIVHELVHLLAPNHGKVFKSFMHAYLPDWQRREKRLQQRTGKRQPLNPSHGAQRHPRPRTTSSGQSSANRTTRETRDDRR